MRDQPHAGRYLAAIFCEDGRLMQKYGEIPASMAIARVEDRVAREAGISRDQLDARVSGAGRVDSERCPALPPRRELPNGLAVDVVEPRPVPPQRPW